MNTDKLNSLQDFLRAAEEAKRAVCARFAEEVLAADASTGGTHSAWNEGAYEELRWRFSKEMAVALRPTLPREGRYSPAAGLSRRLDYAASLSSRSAASASAFLRW